MPDSNMLLLTLPDVAQHCQTLNDYRKLRWRPPKPEMKITIERFEPATRFQRLPRISDHAGQVCDIADTDRRWLVAGIQDGGHYFTFLWPPF